MAAHAMLIPLVWAVVLFAQIMTVHSSQSTLKVAVCNPGQLPYANMDDNGNLVGYDIGTESISASAVKHTFVIDAALIQVRKPP
jgi:hypothetical protein